MLINSWATAWLSSKANVKLKLFIWTALAARAAGARVESAGDGTPALNWIASSWL